MHIHIRLAKENFQNFEEEIDIKSIRLFNDGNVFIFMICFYAYL